VLTFFDYLRQRAFESVLSGAQDALNFLERQKSFNESKKHLLKPAESPVDETPQAPRKKVADKTPTRPPKGDDKPIEPPRDRGRPVNEARQNQ
jgi:hypothetical protein